MSLVWLEGFGAYAAGTHPVASSDDLKMQFSNWVETPTITEESTAQGRRCVMTGASGQNNLNMTIKSQVAFDSTTIVVGCRVYHEGLSGDVCIFRFEDGVSDLGYFLIDNGGRWQYSTTSQQRIGGSVWAETAIPPYVSTYLEMKIVFNGSTGTVDFWQNGVAVGSYTSLDTVRTGSSCDGIRIGNSDAYSDWESDGVFSITDIYVDTADQHGPMEIWYQPADAAGSAANWTPAASTNHSQVDDIGSDADSTYNESTATTTLDQLGHTDTVNVGPLAVQPMVMARYVPTGSANIQVGLLSSTTHDQDSAKGLVDPYDGVQGKIYVLDPDTASAWTAGGCDAAETTYEHA